MAAILAMPSASSFDFDLPPNIAAAIEAAQNSVELTRIELSFEAPPPAIDEPMPLNVVGRIMLRIQGERTLSPIAPDASTFEGDDETWT